MPSKEALKMAEDYIKSQLGTLSDLPKELANTIANVYYKFALDFLEMSENSKREYFVPKSMNRKTGDLGELLKDFMANQAKIPSDVEAAPKFVKGLREIDKYKQAKLYKYSVEFILDCLKYNIEKPQNKSGARRTIERKFKTVNEIPNLIDSMTFGGDSKIIIDCPNPNCSQKLRVPCGRRLRVTCPKCKHVFEV
jgi:hypothetical protein